MSQAITIPKRTMWALLALVALMQTVALAYVVYSRDQLLKHGREIVMQVTPVDPRDIFRGDYVILGFPMSRIEITGEKFGALSEGLESGGEIYVTMTPGNDNEWSVAKVSATYPKENGPKENGTRDAVLKGRVESVDRNAAPDKTWVSARYGVESYFVPEGTGKVLEQQVSDKKIQAILAVGPDGTAATKGLIVGGERHVAPPLF